ncbi:MAG: tRNA pseudouridine(38-40) synthase TruA [Alphaproteobacteria bacterium]|nr:tRNA pseudouridine(38-40) synthase TruA [Alphaproteobacteria bacterium]
MTRFVITIEYDGRAFVGWQRQANGFAVQEAIETAIQRLSGEEVTLYGAGRTDAGVHALGQVAHFNLERAFDVETIRDGLNAHLRPHPIAILNAKVADSAFDARRSATQRVYRYRILNRRSPSALEEGRVWHVGMPLDAEAMANAATVLVGKHDFTSFRSTFCQAVSPVKTLDELSVIRKGDEIHVEASARSFLHNQVRIFVGTLKLVGDGKWTKADVEAALAARDRAKGGPTAPAEGLYLLTVRYEPV